MPDTLIYFNGKSEHDTGLRVGRLAVRLDKALSEYFRGTPSGVGMQAAAYLAQQMTNAHSKAWPSFIAAKAAQTPVGLKTLSKGGMVYLQVFGDKKAIGDFFIWLKTGTTNDDATRMEYQGLSFTGPSWAVRSANAEEPPFRYNIRKVTQPELELPGTKLPAKLTGSRHIFVGTCFSRHHEVPKDMGRAAMFRGLGYNHAQADWFDITMTPETVKTFAGRRPVDTSLELTSAWRTQNPGVRRVDGPFTAVDALSSLAMGHLDKLTRVPLPLDVDTGVTLLFGRSTESQPERPFYGANTEPLLRAYTGDKLAQWNKSTGAVLRSGTGTTDWWQPNLVLGELTGNRQMWSGSFFPRLLLLGDPQHGGERLLRAVKARAARASAAQASAPSLVHTPTFGSL